MRSTNGYFDLIGSPTPYWGEIPEREMKETLTIAQSQGYREALATVAASHPQLANYLLSWARTDWIFHWIRRSIRSELSAELGSGWGNLAIGLSRYFRNVVSIESVPSRIQFQAIRGKEMGIGNIVYARASALNPPLPDGELDLIVSNGLLEWIALSRPEDNARETQVSFLRTCRRKLSPDGCLFIGIENRIGAGNFVGVRDHSGYPFTSLMPRALASAVVWTADRVTQLEFSEKRTETPRDKYMTWTYSVPGYRRLLADAGFGYVEIYWCYPSYNQPKFSGNLSDEGGPKSFARWVVQRTGHEMAIHKRMLAGTLAVAPKHISMLAATAFWPNLLIFAYARRPSQRPSGMSLGQHEILMGGSDRKNASVSLIEFDQRAIKRFTRISRFPVSEPMTTAGMIGSIESQGFAVREEKVMNARPFNPFSQKDNEALVRWLLEYQDRKSSQPLAASAIAGEIQTLLASREFELLDGAVRESVRTALTGLAIPAALTSLRTVPEHGDLWYGNVFILSSGKPVVLDWEYSRENGIELFDLTFYLLTVMMNGRKPLAEVRANLAGVGPFSKIARRCLSLFAESTSVEPKRIADWIPYVLLRLLIRHSPRGDEWSESYGRFKALISVWPEIDKTLLEA